MEKEWNTQISVDSCKVNFFTLSVYFKKGIVLPATKKQYAWQFDQCKVHVSPFKLLFNKQIALYLTFNNIKAETAYADGKSDLLDHLNTIFTPKVAGPLKISPQAIALHNFDLSVQLASKKIHFALPCSFHIQRDTVAPDQKQPDWQGTLTLNNATIQLDDKIIAKNLTGCTVFHKDNILRGWYGSLTTTLTSPLLGEATPYTIEGKVTPEYRGFMLKDAQNATNITSLITHDFNVALKGDFPVSLFGSIAKGLSGQGDGIALISPTQGRCAIDLTLAAQDNRCNASGSVVFSDLKIANLSLDRLALNFVKSNSHTTSSAVDIQPSSNTQLTGSATWDWDKGTGALSLSNAFPITQNMLSGTATRSTYSLQPHDLTLNMKLARSGDVSGTYKCIITNEITEKQYAYKGAVLVNKQKLNIKGATSRGDYCIKAALAPHPHITQWLYTSKKKSLINLRATQEDPMTIQGTVSWSLLKSFLDQTTRHLIFDNHCMFTVKLNQGSLDQFNGSVHLSQGRFYIPEYHNLIQNIHADISLQPQSKKITFSNVELGLSKGSITVPLASITLASDYSVGTIHAPFQVNNIFINWKRDFYGFVYGNLLLNKVPDNAPLLSGTLVLKKSLLKDSFFAHEGRAGAYGPTGTVLPGSSLPLGLDIKVVTEKPLLAQTSSIQTAASANLVIHSSPQKDFGFMPYVTGTINLGSGFLKFMRNKLHIEYGKIQFLASQMNDPLIDLIAKNRINKYLITLQATGSLQKPTILLESTPDLTEEQIIGLLLAGSENATLQADLPTMLLQNLDSLLLGHNKKSSKTGAFFDKISKTFRYVQITPNLQDASGKGGLRGSISVNLSEQLHAQIQKNLTFQSDDFSAQLEYLLSDDINLKVVRDQRGEVGSELEVRLKL